MDTYKALNNQNQNLSSTFSIFNIKKVIGSLTSDKQKIVKRIFFVDVCKSRLLVPKTMKPWIHKHFKNVDVSHQTIVRIFNYYTLESSLFNSLRAMRPLHAPNYDKSVELEISKKDAFCDPTRLTPRDVFGRVKSKNSITASNIAKYDKNHGLVIFKEHDPRRFSETQLQEYIDTALKWIKKASAHDKKAFFPLIGWNCLWRSGASVVHGHLQLLLARNYHYTYAERLRKAMSLYNRQYNNNYFQDLNKTYEYLGLGFYHKKIFITPSLTPAKEKEIIIIHQDLTKEFVSALFFVVKTLQQIGVESFNVSIFLPPLKQLKAWNRFPVIARIVDRGPLTSRTSDIGFLELLANTSIVSHDPFFISKLLKTNNF